MTGKVSSPPEELNELLVKLGSMGSEKQRQAIPLLLNTVNVFDFAYDRGAASGKYGI